MNRKREVLSIGDVLVDFVSTKSGVSLKSAPQFIKCAGGAPANVAVGISRLGTRSAFIGKVGNDSFGRFLVSELRGAGVNTSGMVFDSFHKTRLAFVSLKKNGERDFEFWERQPADEQLQYSEIDSGSLAQKTIVNIGSFLLLKNPSRNTALQAARQAGSFGCEVCFDPNLRLSLWENQDEGRRVMMKMIHRSTIVRLNDTEAAFFAGTRDAETAAEKIRKMGPGLVVITLGSRGCYYQTDALSGFVRGFGIRPVDTTGCGDGFLAGLLHGLAQSDKRLDEFLPEEMQAICTVANAVGALVAMKRGAIAAMPSTVDLQRFLKRKRDQ